MVFMYVSYDDRAVSWPELGKVEEVDAEEVMKTYEELGMPAWNSGTPSVVSLPEGSEHALHLLGGEINREDVLCISVRATQGENRSWWLRLEDMAKEHNILVVDHNRHDVLEAIAFRLFTDGLRAIEDSADILRGEGIDTSNEAMRTEMALTRAIQTLKASGFRAPRKK